MESYRLYLFLLIVIIRKKTNLKLKEEGSMISDFIGAAAPWVTMGLFIAIICSFMGKKAD